MRRIGMLALVAACAACSGTTESDCDKIAEDIRMRAGARAQGICFSTAPEDVKRFGEACKALKECNASL